MFGKSAVEAIRHAATAHERAAKNTATTVLDIGDSVERIEFAVFVLVGIVVGLLVADRLLSDG